MEIREAAKKAYEDRRARNLEDTQQGNITVAKETLDLLVKQLEIERDVAQLDPPYVTVGDLRFTSRYVYEACGNQLFLVILCPNCNKQYQEAISSLADLGHVLDKRNGHRCKHVQDELQPICPVMSSYSTGEELLYADCAGDCCAWWARCQGTPSINGLMVGAVETKVEQLAVPPQWAYIELMGHDSIVGQMSEGQVAGVTMLRVDVPAVDGKDGYTRFLGRSAIFRLTPIDEAKAQAMLSQMASRNYLEDDDMI